MKRVASKVEQERAQIEMTVEQERQAIEAQKDLACKTCSFTVPISGSEDID